MTIPCNAGALLYAVIEHLASSTHIYDPVEEPPWQDSQYRIVCLAARPEDAWKIAHLLCTVTRGPHAYTVCPIGALSGNESDDNSINVAEPDEIKTGCADPLS